MPVEKRRLFHACLVFVVTVELFLFPLLITPFFNAPPEAYDAADYDAIALQLARGKGYSVDWDSPEYRSLYAGNPAYAYLDTHTGAYLTAFRPPLYPLLMAGVYRVFGRVFYPLRVINVLA